MQLDRDRVFDRQFKKLHEELREKLRERVHLLSIDEFSPLLKNHKVSPPFEGYRSINITGDWRLVYKKLGPDSYYLRAVSTHHQLFGT